MSSYRLCHTRQQAVATSVIEKTSICCTMQPLGLLSLEAYLTVLTFCRAAARTGIYGAICLDTDFVTTLKQPELRYYLSSPAIHKNLWIKLDHG
jgi:hypothetical protein